MEKLFKFNYHSFIDIITNSSTELFVSTDKKVVEFFKEYIKENIGEKYGSTIKLYSFKDYIESSHLKDIKEDEPENFDNYVKNKYGDMKDDDLIVVCNVDSEDSHDFIGELLLKIGFKNVD
jgi:hypothetical protein